MLTTGKRKREELGAAGLGFDGGVPPGAFGVYWVRRISSGKWASKLFKFKTMTLDNMCRKYSILVLRTS